MATDHNFKVKKGIDVLGGDVNLGDGFSYKIDGTTVVDSSRNLTNTHDITFDGVARSTNNANVDGPNFNVSTTNKSTTEYAYRVDRSGTVKGGITINGIFKSATGIDLTEDSAGYVNLHRGGFITFYGNSNSHHAIGSRNESGDQSDDLRINTYAALHINLDSNSNNTSSANFTIGRHGGGTGTISNLFTVSGEDGTTTVPYVRITGTGDAALSSTTHGLQIGSTSGNNVIFDDNEIMARSNGGTATLYLQGDGGTVSIGGGTAANLTVTGSLTVQGTTTTLNTANLNVQDKNITLNYGSGDTSASANGSGITIQDAVNSSTDATILWDSTNDEFDFSHAVNINGKITGNNEFRLDNGTGGTTHLNYQDGGSNYIRGTTTYIDTLLDLNSNNITDAGTITGTAVVVKRGTTYAQSTDYLYVGGNSLDGADAAIYLGNHGGGSGYGWRLYYHGSGSGNLNDLSIQSENLGSPVNVLRFNQDGAATFVNNLDIANPSGDSLIRIAHGAGNNYDAVLEFSGSASNIATEGLQIWYDNSVGDAHFATTYVHDDAYLRFHTRTGASKSTSNERLTIAGHGTVGINKSTGLNSSYKLDMGGHIHMNNNHIHYINQAHFHQGTRFIGSSTSTTILRSASSTNSNWIAFQSGSDSTTRGYVGGNADSGHSVGLLDQGGNWAVRHVNDQGTIFYSDNQSELGAIGKDLVGGDYGSMVVKDYKNSWAGYSINNHWVFMSSGAGNAGIYNDTNNEWAVLATQNADVKIYHNGNVKITTSSSGATVTGTVEAGAYSVDNRKFIDMPSNSAERGAWNPIVSSIRGSGRVLYNDEDFSSGVNSIGVYNNSGGGTVTITREDATTSSGGSAPNSSGKVLKIYWNGGTASPNRGGFIQTIPSEDNHTFVQIFQAKAPSGSTLHINENAQGTNSTSYWLTNNTGTGEWEWYARISHCGDSGSFSSGGHVSISGPSSAFSWYLASCTVIDVTETPLLWSAYNDGSGSGLDADTLDGQQGTVYFKGYDNTSGWQNSNQNFSVRGGGTGAVGLHMEKSNGSFGFQLYGDGTNYGFLDGEWANWDIQKVTNGKLYLNGSTTYFLQPEASDSAKFFRYVQIGDSSSYGSNSGTWGARLNVTDDVHAKIEVGQDTDSMLSHWYAHQNHSSIKFGTATAHDVEFQRNGSTSLEIESGGLMTMVPIRRNSHHASGFLEGSYNSVGSSNNAATNPIYTIGSNYNPNETTLNNMYGIGFTKNSTASFLSGDLDVGDNNGWGLYVAADGDARIFLNGSDGIIQSTGQHYADGSLVWNGGNDGSGSGLDADLLDGLHGSSYMRSTGMLDNTDVYINARVIRNNNSSSHRDGMYIGYSNSNSGHTRLFGGGATSGGLYIRGSGANDLTYGNNTGVIWHSANDGSGTGLDADLLDGYHLSGSSSIATKIFNNKGQNHSTVTNFNTAMTPGPNYVQSYTNGPENTGQWYGFMLGLGNEYGTTTGSSGHYASQMYYKRNASNNANYLYMRSMESGNWQSWLKVSAGYADSAGSATNADTVDNLHASSFLRSNAADEATGDIEFSGGAHFGSSAEIGIGDAAYAYTSVGHNASNPEGIFWHTSASYGIWRESGNWSSPSYPRLIINWPVGIDINGGNMNNGYTYEGVNIGGGSNSALRVNGNTAWHAGNDGSGSTLDADLLDGVHGASFLRSDAADTASGNLTFTGNLNQTGGSFTSNGFTTTDLNTAWQAAGTSKSVGIAPFRYQNSASNKPESGDNAHWGLNIYAHSGSSGNYPYGHQLSAASSGNIWQRWFANGSAGSWKKIWDSGNDGSGSALDADLVDGLHASQFVRSDTADTLTGALTLNVSGDALVISSTAPQMKFNDTSGEDDFWIHVNSNRFYILPDRDESGGWETPYAMELNASTNVPYLFGNKAWTAGNDGSGSGLDADLLDGQDSSYYARYDHFRSLGTQAFTGTASTAGLVSEMDGDGAFDSYTSAFKTSWSYAGNFNMSDAGRFTETAGTAFLTWTDNSSDSARGNITVLAIAPNTGGSAGKMFVYNDQGSSYAPGWREIWTSTSDGSGSGLDADTVDGIQGASLLRSDANDTASGVVTFSNGSNSTATTNGAVRITGGLGVGYNVHAGGVVRCNSGFVVNTTTVINSSRVLQNLESGSASTGLRFTVSDWLHSTDGKGRFYLASGSHSYYKSGGTSAKHLFRNGLDSTKAEIDAGGNAIFSGNVTAYGSPSDIRLKENIEVIPDSIEKVKNLRGITFNYKKDGKRSTGLVAQELQKVLPEAVYETKDAPEDGEDILAIRYGNVVGLLVEALKEQQTQIDNLTTLVNELKEK